MRSPAIIVRETTGCAITEAQKALLETNGSIDEAISLCVNTQAQHARSCPKSKTGFWKDACTCRRENEPQ